MVILHLQHKVKLTSQDCDLAWGRQTLIFRLAKIDCQHDGSTFNRRRAQDPDAARFDQAPDFGRWAAGYQVA